MSQNCPNCDSPRLSQYEGIDGEILCEECARREISALLSDEEPQRLKKLRRKMEDVIRKDADLQEELIIFLVIQGKMALYKGTPRVRRKTAPSESPPRFT